MKKKTKKKEGGVHKRRIGRPPKEWSVVLLPKEVTATLGQQQQQQESESKCGCGVSSSLGNKNAIAIATASSKGFVVASRGASSVHEGL